MKRENFLMAIIVLLLLLNTGTLAYLFWARPAGFPPPHGHPPRPETLLMDNLDWSDEQVKQFEASRERHRSVMDSLDQVFGQQFKQLMQPEALADTSSITDSLKNTLAAIELQRAGNTLRHFAELRAICNEEQKKKFDELLPRLFEMLQRKPQRPRHPH